PRALASNTWFVDGVNGNDNNDCKSPQTSCKTIAHAISLASSGDSVRVAPATYTEHLKISFSLNVIVSGAKTTIMDDHNLYNRPVVYISAGNTNVTLSNVTIRHGEYGCGGGIYNRGTLRIKDSTISSNVGSGYGGGICNWGTLTFSHGTVRKNVS